MTLQGIGAHCKPLCNESLQSAWNGARMPPSTRFRHNAQRAPRAHCKARRPRTLLYFCAIRGFGGEKYMEKAMCSLQCISWLAAQSGDVAIADLLAQGFAQDRTARYWIDGLERQGWVRQEKI